MPAPVWSVPWPHSTAASTSSPRTPRRRRRGHAGQMLAEQAHGMHQQRVGERVARRATSALRSAMANVFRPALDDERARRRLQHARIDEDRLRARLGIEQRQALACLGVEDRAARLHRGGRRRRRDDELRQLRRRSASGCSARPCRPAWCRARAGRAPSASEDARGARGDDRRAAADGDHRIRLAAAAAPRPPPRPTAPGCARARP